MGMGALGGFAQTAVSENIIGRLGDSDNKISNVFNYIPGLNKLVGGKKLQDINESDIYEDGDENTTQSGKLLAKKGEAKFEIEEAVYDEDVKYKEGDKTETDIEIPEQNITKTITKDANGNESETRTVSKSTSKQFDLNKLNANITDTNLSEDKRNQAESDLKKYNELIAKESELANDANIQSDSVKKAELDNVRAELNAIKSNAEYQIDKPKMRTIARGTQLTKDDIEQLNESNVLRHKKGDRMYQRDTINPNQYVYKQQMLNPDGTIKEGIKEQDARIGLFRYKKDKNGKEIPVYVKGKDGKDRLFSSRNRAKETYSRLEKQALAYKASIEKSMRIANAKMFGNTVENAIEGLNSLMSENLDDKQRAFEIDKITDRLALIELIQEGKIDINSQTIQERKIKILAEKFNLSNQMSQKDMRKLQYELEQLSADRQTLLSIENGDESIIMQMWKEIYDMTPEQAKEKNYPDDYKEFALKAIKRIEYLSDVYYEYKSFVNSKIGFDDTENKMLVRALFMNRISYDRMKNELRQLGEELDKNVKDVNLDELLVPFLNNNKLSLGTQNNIKDALYKLFNEYNSQSQQLTFSDKDINGDNLDISAEYAELVGKNAEQIVEFYQNKNRKAQEQLEIEVKQLIKQKEELAKKQKDLNLKISQLKIDKKEETTEYKELVKELKELRENTTIFDTETELRKKQDVLNDELTNALSEFNKNILLQKEKSDEKYDKEKVEKVIEVLNTNKSADIDSDAIEQLLKSHKDSKSKKSKSPVNFIVDEVLNTKFIELNESINYVTKRAKQLDVEFDNLIQESKRIQVFIKKQKTEENIANKLALIKLINDKLKVNHIITKETRENDNSVATVYYMTKKLVPKDIEIEEEIIDPDDDTKTIKQKVNIRTYEQIDYPIPGYVDENGQFHSLEKDLKLVSTEDDVNDYMYVVKPGFVSNTGLETHLGLVLKEQNELNKLNQELKKHIAKKSKYFEEVAAYKKDLTANPDKYDEFKINEKKQENKIKYDELTAKQKEIEAKIKNKTSEIMSHFYYNKVNQSKLKGTEYEGYTIIRPYFNDNDDVFKAKDLKFTVSRTIVNNTNKFKPSRLDGEETKQDIQMNKVTYYQIQGVDKNGKPQTFTFGQTDYTQNNQFDKEDMTDEIRKASIEKLANLSNRYKELNNKYNKTENDNLELKNIINEIRHLYGLFDFANTVSDIDAKLEDVAKYNNSYLEMYKDLLGTPKQAAVKEIYNVSADVQHESGNYTADLSDMDKISTEIAGEKLVSVLEHLLNDYNGFQDKNSFVRNNAENVYNTIQNLTKDDKVSNEVKEILTDYLTAITDYRNNKRKDLVKLNNVIYDYLSKQKNVNDTNRKTELHRLTIAVEDLFTKHFQMRSMTVSNQSSMLFKVNKKSDTKDANFATTKQQFEDRTGHTNLTDDNTVPRVRTDLNQYLQELSKYQIPANLQDVLFQDNKRKIINLLNDRRSREIKVQKDIADRGEILNPIIDEINTLRQSAEELEKIRNQEQAFADTTEQLISSILGENFNLDDMDLSQLNIKTEQITKLIQVFKDLKMTEDEIKELINPLQFAVNSKEFIEQKDVYQEVINNLLQEKESLDEVYQSHLDSVNTKITDINTELVNLKSQIDLLKQSKIVNPNSPLSQDKIEEITNQITLLENKEQELQKEQENNKKILKDIEKAKDNVEYRKLEIEEAIENMQKQLDNVQRIINSTPALSIQSNYKESEEQLNELRKSLSILNELTNSYVEQEQSLLEVQNRIANNKISNLKLKYLDLIANQTQTKT